MPAASETFCSKSKVAYDQKEIFKKIFIEVGSKLVKQKYKRDTFKRMGFC